MSDFLSITNSLLVTRNYLLSRCCCTTNEEYWEAVPCEWYIEPNEGCADFIGCNVQRKYVATRAICENDVYICECQKLVTYNWTGLTSVNASAFSFGLNANYNIGTGIFDATGCSLSARYIPTSTIYRQNFNYSSYETITDLITAINAYSPGGTPAYTLTNNFVHPSSVVDSVEHGTYTYPIAGSVDVPNEDAGIFIGWSGTQTALIPYVANLTLFNTLTQTALQNIAGLEDITSTQDYRNSVLTDPIFYITFNGSQCGIIQPNLDLTYRWVGVGGSPTAPEFFYGDYITGWGQDGLNYTLVPSGDTVCPYDTSPYAVYTESLQCCPQRGLHLGANQNLPGTTEYGSDFQNLENTVVIDTIGSDSGICYKLTPYAFLFGKDGRLFDDPNSDRANSTFIVADCDYTTGACDYGVPSNGQLELFIPRFSEQIPWGPFGSYKLGLEDEEHPAYTALLNGQLSGGQNYPADNSFRGYHYAPSGTIRTLGKWTATTGIQLTFQFYSFEPFWVGTSNPSFTNRRLGKIDATTLSSAFSVASGNNCSGLTILNYNCSGKTVWNFISEINQIQTLEVSGQSCNVFSFCPGASSGSLNAISCSKINNLSAELYDRWKQNGSYSNFYLINDPQWDQAGYGGSSIWPYPASWDKILADSASSADKPNAFSGSTYAPALPMILPPIASRHNTYPKEATFNGFVRYNCRPFWLTMAGHEELAATIIKTTGTFDADALALTVTATTGFISIVVSSGATTLYSSGINTIKNSSGYTHSDLVNEINALRFPRYINPASLYQPLIATSGTPGYPIWIDDTTWADAATVLYDGTRSPTDPGTGFRTVPNFGYQEPFNDVASTNLFDGVTQVTLYSWVRERVITNNSTSCSAGLPRNLLPWEANRFDPPDRLNCDADSVYENNWLLTYGCNSHICKTEWFIKAQRCGCTTLPVCGEDGGPIFEDNPYNLATYTDCSKLITPTFYMCEGNLHPECDIPFLVKVPQMFICQQGRTDCFFNNNGDECWLNPDTAGPCSYIARCPFASGDIDSLQVGYLTATHGCQSFMDINTLRCWMNKPYDGWCQYIDPTNLDLVRREDIPRTWPPSVLVMEKSTEPFCTRNVNFFDEDTGVDLNACNDPFTGDVPYDALTPLWPLVPANYLVPPGEANAGWPCFLAAFGSNELFAYIRPIVKNFHASGLCNSVECLKTAIDCNTRCCHCGYVCNTETEDCYSGPSRNCQQDQSISYTSQETGPGGCCLISPVSGAGSCNYGAGCACPAPPGGELPALYPPIPNCYDATYQIDINIEFSKTVTPTLVLGYTLDALGSCVPVTDSLNCCWNATGNATTIYDRQDTCGGSCWWDCCGTMPPSGCSGPATCDYTTISPQDCSSDLLSFGPTFTTSSSGIILGYYDCNDPCDDEFPDRACDSTELSFYETYQIQNYLDGRNGCGIGNITWDSTIHQYFNGNSTQEACGSGIGGIPLGIKFGPGASTHSCTCASWDIPNGYVYRGDGRIFTEDGVISYGTIDCSICSFDNVAGNTDYNYIVTKQLPWVCGLFNEITLATGSFTDPNICP